MLWRLSMDGIISGCHPRSVWRSGKAATTSLVRTSRRSCTRTTAGSSANSSKSSETGATVDGARFRTGDQVYRWVSIQARAWRGPTLRARDHRGNAGCPTRCRGSATLEQNERLLRLTIGKRRRVRQCSPSDSTFCGSTRHCGESLERDRDWLFGHALRPLVPGGSRQAAPASGTPVVGDIERADYEMRIVLPSGAESWLRHTMALLIERDSRPSCFVSHGGRHR